MEHGMNKYKLSLITSSLLLAQAMPTYANDVDVNADDLVGKFYGGVHVGYLNADNDRVDNKNTDFSNLKELSTYIGESEEARLTFAVSFLFGCTLITT